MKNEDSTYYVKARDIYKMNELLLPDTNFKINTSLCFLKFRNRYINNQFKIKVDEYYSNRQKKYTLSNVKKQYKKAQRQNVKKSTVTTIDMIEDILRIPWKINNTESLREIGLRKKHKIAHPYFEGTIFPVIANNENIRYIYDEIMSLLSDHNRIIYDLTYQVYTYSQRINDLIDLCYGL